MTSYILSDYFNGGDAEDFRAHLSDAADDLAWKEECRIQDSDALSDMEVMRGQHSLTRKQMGIL